MNRTLLIPVLLSLLCNCLLAAEVYFGADFDSGIPAGINLANARIVEVPGLGGTLNISVKPGSPAPHTVGITLPVDRIRGNSIFWSADVRGENISNRPNSWNGVKVMMVIQTPWGTNYPQPDIPLGTFEWRRFSSSASIPADAVSVTLILGLEQVTGNVWFDNVSVTHRKKLVPIPAADPSQPVFRGHNLSRLRGAMAGTRLKEEDISHFADNWKGNLIRWQFTESARNDRPLDQYDAWLDAELENFDKVLEWCRKYRVLIALDLHSPPGGQAFSAGYITARGDIFQKTEAQDKFIETWEKIANRYKGERIIWGFDLMNEPDDSMLIEGCLDWYDLAEKAAKAIRKIDPERTLIIEPNNWGTSAAFASFAPINLPNCVYSFHLYAPHQFTHQAIQNNPAGVSYPGMIDGAYWDKAMLKKQMQPAIDFANRYRVHMYVGEFSAIRVAPEGSATCYLSDVTELFEELGYDWSYHAYREWNGWSLEHEGPLNKPVKASTPTDREAAITKWFARNQKP